MAMGAKGVQECLGRQFQYYTDPSRELEMVRGEVATNEGEILCILVLSSSAPRITRSGVKLPALLTRQRKAGALADG
jgi:hypothetical protein